jgi:hypothetical protein
MSANLIGRTLLNQFRIDSFVASGGMGAVYRVWDMKRNVPLAMKVLHADLAEDPSIFKLFQREAQALEKLAHPNIVPFYGLHQAEGLAFILQLFVDGPSLKDILRDNQGRPLSVEDSLIYLKAVSAALGYAHANGIVHCDIKPGNVMIDRGGVIYLADFGIARFSEGTVTTTFAGAGTPAYMAPEQVRQEPVMPVTDVYALGVMLFELLTGVRPFRGGGEAGDKAGSTTAERIRYEHLHLPPPDPHYFNPALPSDLKHVLWTAMAKEPHRRYQNTQALYLAACQAAGVAAGSVPDRVRLLPAGAVSAAATLPYPTLAQTTPARPAGGAAATVPPEPPGAVTDAVARSRRSPWLWVTAGGLILLFLAILVGFGAWKTGIFSLGERQDQLATQVAQALSTSIPPPTTENAAQAQPTSMSDVSTASAARQATEKVFALYTVQAELTQTALAKPTDIPSPTSTPITPSPTSTQPPSLTPTPIVSFYDLRACTSESYYDGECVASQSVITGPIRRVYLSWRSRDLSNGMEITRDWYKDDQYLWSTTNTIGQNDRWLLSLPTFWIYIDAQEGSAAKAFAMDSLPAGNYRMVLKLNGQVITEITFTIQNN